MNTIQTEWGKMRHKRYKMRYSRRVDDSIHAALAVGWGGAVEPQWRSVINRQSENVRLLKDLY
jgi:hypothetical protein